MAYKTIVITTKKGNQISIITLNRPAALNAFDVTMASELDQALLGLDRDTITRVLVIEGSGRGFSSGIDLSTGNFESMTPTEYYQWATLMEQASLTITRMKKPVIASVHGFAVANALGLVAACDLAIAEKGSLFGATAINVGLNCIGPQVSLVRNLGKKKTLELVLTGNRIDAHEAERIGLINKVVPQGKLREETINMAESLADKSPLALQLAKRSFYDIVDMEFSKALELVNNQFALLCTLEDSHEGVRAFKEKGQPQWHLK